MFVATKCPAQDIGEIPLLAPEAAGSQSAVAQREAAPSGAARSGGLMHETGNSILGFVSNALPSKQPSPVASVPSRSAPAQNAPAQNAPAQNAPSRNAPARSVNQASPAATALQRQRMQFELERRKQSAAQPGQPTASGIEQIALPQKSQPESAALFGSSKPQPNPAQGAASSEFNGLASPFTGKPDPIDLTQTIKRIGTATFLVLAGCCAILVIGKRFGLGQGKSGQHRSDGSSATTSGNGSAGRSSTIEVLETRKLLGRCQLKLVAVDDCRFLVAMDGGGVKSMQAVTPSFQNALADITPEEIATAEQNVRDSDANAISPVGPDRGAPNSIAEDRALRDEELGRRLTSLIERL